MGGFRIRGDNGGIHPHPSLPPSRGKGGEGKGRRWVPACARTTGGGIRFLLWWNRRVDLGKARGWGFSWGDGSRGGGFWARKSCTTGGGTGAREGNGRAGVLMGGMVARRIEGMGPRIREETGGGSGNGGGLREEGVLMGGMVARRGRGDGFPCTRGNGRGARERRGLREEGVLMGGMVARRIEGMGSRVREGNGRGSPPS